MNIKPFSVKYRFSFPTALILMLTCMPVATATFFDIDGEVTSCNAFACSLAGISTGDPISGYLEVDDAAALPGSTFTQTDILEFLATIGDIGGSPSMGPFGTTSLDVDMGGEISAGSAMFTTTVDTGIGLADVDIVLDASAGTWTASTGFLGLGTVASGTLTFTRRVDTDGDGIQDSADNCILHANADQRDTNSDGYGNICDPDIDNTGIVNFADFALITSRFLATPASPDWDPDVDLNGDDVVNFIDISLFPPFFLGPPGPSGTAP